MVDIDNLVYINNCWYSISSPKIKVRLEDGFKITIFLDTRAEINIKTRELIEDAGLVMRKGLKLEFGSHMSYSKLFLGL